jgi:hypothetical protein
VPSASADIAGMAPASTPVHTQSQGGESRGGRDKTMPPGARPTMMGVQEADVAQACRQGDKSGQGKELGSGRGRGRGNNSGYVAVQAVDGR